MKKIAAIFLMLTVLISSIGVSVNTHICKKEGVIKSYFVDFGECVCEIEIEEAPAHKCCHKQAVEKTEQKGWGNIWGSGMPLGRLWTASWGPT